MELKERSSRYPRERGMESHAGPELLASGTRAVVTEQESQDPADRTAEKWSDTGRVSRTKRVSGTYLACKLGWVQVRSCRHLGMAIRADAE